MGAPGVDIVGIKAANVAEWFEANVEGAEAPLGFELLAGGHSNLTYRVTDANGAAFVLRRPPTGRRAGHRPRHGPRAQDHLRGRPHRRARAGRHRRVHR